MGASKYVILQVLLLLQTGYGLISFETRRNRSGSIESMTKKSPSLSNTGVRGAPRMMERAEINSAAERGLERTRRKLRSLSLHGRVPNGAS